MSKTGDIIKARRRELGMTQERLGEKIGLQKSAVAKYENGRVENIKKSMIRKLSEALEVTPAYLMGWEDPPSQSEIDRMETAFKPFGVTVKYEEDPEIGEQYINIYYNNECKGEIADELVNLYNEVSNESPAAVQEAVDAYFAGRKRIKNIIQMPSKEYPLIGNIAAGVPILSSDSIEDYISIEGEVDADFCLRVCGDSMKNANINDGDIVFLKMQDYVTDGRILAVVKEDADTYDAVATLKRVYQHADGYLLVPANEAYSPEVWSGDKIRIIGQVVYCLSKVR